MLMPFQILGMWLRGLLSAGLLALGIGLLLLWNDRREVRVVETVREPRPADAGRPPEPGREPAPAAPREREVVRVEHWQFGLNGPTALLVGGLALVAFSLGGGIVLSPSLWRRRGPDEPKQLRTGEVRRLLRPDGSQLQVELYGPADGPPVVLTHGWGLDSGEWYYAKKRLAERHRVIVWDLPGLGRSGRPRDNDWSLERLASDLEAVLALAGDRPAVLVGHSIGGMIILTFCKLFPEALGRRVAGLVIADSTYTNPVNTTSGAAFYRAIQKPVLEPLCHLMVWLSPLCFVLNLLSYLNGSAQRWTDRSSFSGHETRGQLNFISWLYVKGWPGVLARGMLGMFRYDATAVLPTVSVPTLIVVGAQDSTCEPEASEYMSRQIPGAQLVMPDPAKHCAPFEHHERFHEEIERFVTECAVRPEHPAYQPAGHA